MKKLSKKEEQPSFKKADEIEYSDWEKQHTREYQNFNQLTALAIDRLLQITKEIKNAKITVKAYGIETVLEVFEKATTSYQPRTSTETKTVEKTRIEVQDIVAEYPDKIKIEGDKIVTNSYLGKELFSEISKKLNLAGYTYSKEGKAWVQK